MKKIYASIVMLLMVSAAYGQRTIRLDFNLVSPPQNYTINVGDNFSQEFVVTVLGPDAVTPGDSLLYRDVTSDPNNTNLFWVMTGYTKAVGDTIMVSKGLQLNNAAQNGPQTYCVYGLFQNAANPINADSLYGDCNDIVITGATNGIGNLEFGASNNVVSKLASVYPNPARAEATFVVNTVRVESVAVSIVDMAGRVVLTENKGTMSKGEHKITVPTSHLVPGVYLYKVTMGDQTVTGKMSVAK